MPTFQIHPSFLPSLTVILNGSVGVEHFSGGYHRLSQLHIPCRNIRLVIIDKKSKTEEKGQCFKFVSSCPSKLLRFGHGH